MARAIIVPVSGNARYYETDGSLRSMQEAVGGLIEPVDAVFGSAPFRTDAAGSLFTYVNEEGLYLCEPNRAIYATRRMAEAGYRSLVDGQPVAEGDLFALLFGDVLVVRQVVDEEGNCTLVDAADEDLARVGEVFGGPGSAIMEIIRMQVPAIA